MQKYSPSHMTTGEEQTQRGSAIVSRSGIGNEPLPPPAINRWYLCHVVESRVRFAVFCTSLLPAVPCIASLNANEIPNRRAVGVIASASVERQIADTRKGNRSGFCRGRRLWCQPVSTHF